MCSKQYDIYSGAVLCVVNSRIYSGGSVVCSKQ